MYASPCACKGIRTCNLCEPSKDQLINQFSSNTVFIYCDACRQAVRMDIYESNAQCPHHSEIGNDTIAFPLDGIYLVSDFISEEEEEKLVKAIDNDVWIASQSGRSKQDFGIKINFKKQTIKTKYFTGMPMYSKEFIERFPSHRILHDFQSVELCNLEYRPERGSHIDPHIDDIWIWGERLITINLLSNTILSLTPNDKDTKKTIYIPLPRRWMIVLYGDARYEYKHAVQRQHIQERRLAITLRELTGKQEKFYEENNELYERITRIGKRFTGISVGRFEQIVNEVNAIHKEKTNADGLTNVQKEDLEDVVPAISSLEKLNLSTYSIISEKEYLMKLFPQVTITLEQLQSTLASCQVNEAVLPKSINESHVVLVESSLLSTNQQVGRFLAHWRLATREMPNASAKNPYDDDWFNEQYASIINKKKNSYPFLLSSLFTCQEQISTLSKNQLQMGLLWTNNEQSFYLVDLVVSTLTKIDSFVDNAKEIINAYEEILPLTEDEVQFFDLFLRLQLILLLNETDHDDEKQLDLLEQLSSNVFVLRNVIR